MKSKPFAFALSAILALTFAMSQARAEEAPAPEAPEVAPEVGPAQAMVDSYKAMFQAKRDAGEWPSAEQRGEMADELLAEVDISAFSVEEIDTISKSIPVVYSSHAEAFDAVLAEAAQDPSAQGANAMSMRFRLLSRDTSTDQRAEMIQALFQHPGLIDAWKQGKGYDGFGSFARLDEAQINPLLPEFVTLGSTDTSEMPPIYFSRMASAFYAFAGVEAEGAIEAREPLRVKLVEAIEAKLAEADAETPEQDTKTLTGARDRLVGAYARGTLFGPNAPELDFSWWSNPNDPEQTYSKLSDLKGKVVVLDFWAT